MKGVSWLVLSYGIMACGLLATSLQEVRAQKNENRKGATVTIDGLKSRVPADWAEEKPTSRFRVKQFRLTAVQDDFANAEMAVFYFSEGAGGTAEDNIKR